MSTIAIFNLSVIYFIFVVYTYLIVSDIDIPEAEDELNYPDEMIRAAEKILRVGLSVLFPITLLLHMYLIFRKGFGKR